MSGVQAGSGWIPSWPTGPVGRERSLDVLRGAAIVWMMAFHLAYDLNHFGWFTPRQQFLSDPVWTLQRVAIVSLFMFCAGTAQALAHAQSVPWSRFWRRWAQVAGCAVLVSVATFFVFPQSWISFGVLHGLAIMVLLARLSAGWPRWCWLVAAAVALAAPHGLSHPLFDERWLQGVGLVTRKPVTEDYAPVLPWMGMVWLGMALGPALLRRMAALQVRAVPPGLADTLAHGLGLLGRWPLTAYMLHQPIFWGALMVLH